MPARHNKSQDPNRYSGHVPPPAGGTPARTSRLWHWEETQVHLEHVGDPGSAVRLLLVHGAGGNAAAMWPFASHLARQGFYVTVPDLPGYGATQSKKPGQVRYSHWRRLLADLVRREEDGRPLVIMGASIGGMLAYDTAAATGLASALVVTCLLDPRDREVRRSLTWHPALARLAGPALQLLAGPLANVRVPLPWIANMRQIANNKQLVAEVLSDKRGGGGRVSLGWMRSYLESAPRVEPEKFSGPEVLMVHPGEDRWTPLAASRAFFDRIAAPKALTVLDNCGHFPIEEPGFSQMLTAVTQLLSRIQPPPGAPATGVGCSRARA
ncbi:alpha/beta hydrolase [Pseudarthrobacter sp. NPDC058329]|uniref:alpha/beta hydrolase n=1 Tax=Pseudarthrobacter sp. NPDC058329 TaxID=3346448 RepID=UPI0036DE5832